MTPETIGPARLYVADALDVLATLPENSVDAVVTDPPYGFGDGKRGGFMGHKWDYDVPTVELWAAVLRVLKPGGHLLAFAGTRTQHRMAVRIEDAGFEIRDMIAWVYGSGFSKSYNLRRAGVCSCADGGNPVPVVHPNEERDDDESNLFSVRQRDQQAPKPSGKGGGPGMFEEVQRQEPGGDPCEVFRKHEGSQAPRPEVWGGQSGVEGGQLHRVGQGLSNGQSARAPEGTQERLRLGAHLGCGEDAGKATEAGRGGSPSEPRQSGQPTGEPSSLLQPYGALGAALSGGGACPRCGKIKKEYEGWGTALKPALEPITLARKPLVGTVAANFAACGTGGINVEGGRVEGEGWTRPGSNNHGLMFAGRGMKNDRPRSSSGRWPANLILTYPEDEYMLRDDVTPDQLHKLAEWMNENAKR